MTTPIATAYAAADRPLTAVLDAVPPEAWDRPSTCAGWTVPLLVSQWWLERKPRRRRAVVERREAVGV